MPARVCMPACVCARATCGGLCTRASACCDTALPACVCAQTVESQLADERAAKEALTRELAQVKLLLAETEAEVARTQVSVYCVG